MEQAEPFLSSTVIWQAMPVANATRVKPGPGRADNYPDPEPEYKKQKAEGGEEVEGGEEAYCNTTCAVNGS